MSPLVIFSKRPQGGNKHIGSDFDDFLQEEGLREEVTAAAVKRVIAWQFTQAMKQRSISKTAMALRFELGAGGA